MGGEEVGETWGRGVSMFAKWEHWLAIAGKKENGIQEEEERRKKICG